MTCTLKLSYLRAYTQGLGSSSLPKTPNPFWRSGNDTYLLPRKETDLE